MPTSGQISRRLPTQVMNDKGRYHSLKSTARAGSCGNRSLALTGAALPLGRHVPHFPEAEASADALIGRPECFAAVLAQIVAAGRDAEVHVISVADDGVHAEPAVAGLH